MKLFKISGFSKVPQNWMAMQSFSLFVHFVTFRWRSWLRLGIHECSCCRRLSRFPFIIWAESDCSGQEYGQSLVSTSTRFVSYASFFLQVFFHRYD